MDETLAINSSQNQNNSALNNLSCGSNNIADSATYSNSNTINNTNTLSSNSNNSKATHSKISLRPYQQEALLALDKSHKEGKNRLLISLPTGAGKTIIFANL
ncbi:MAG: DEAD/DEAH box helicase family protein, partial [Blastocatellia bacterium]|nr:DEAD/DEAH box helicase family protein [Blastocatellia bacterium]